MLLQPAEMASHVPSLKLEAPSKRTSGRILPIINEQRIAKAHHEMKLWSVLCKCSWHATVPLVLDPLLEQISQGPATLELAYLGMP